MSPRTNEFDQPIGDPVLDWQPRPHPARRVHEGRYARSYLRIDPEHGVIEVGHLQFSPLLAQTRAATDAMFVMMAHAFDDLGYRRYEWKCDSLNAPSRNAAQRLGFTYEGTFRQAVVYRGRNRDNAWFSITDAEWPALKASFERWLDPSNFDAAGNQHTRLHQELRTER